MKLLGIVVAIFSLAAAYVAHRSGHGVVYLLAGFSLLAAIVTYHAATRTSTFVQILIRFFATEVVVLGACVCMSELGHWPRALDGLRVPNSVAITVALFCVLAYVAAHIPVARRALAIADRYFRMDGMVAVPFGRGRMLRERHVAAAALMFLVLINQIQVILNVKLSFVGQAIFNALQAYNAPAFWHAIFIELPLLLTPYLISLYIEFVVSQTLFIRWREYLTSRYTSRWLDGHNHYKMMLAGVGADNPDQRIQEDIPRFIEGPGGGTGLGIYNFTINLISQLTNLVAYAIILWGESTKLTLPGTNSHIPGFLFWCAVIFAMFGTGITMTIGPLARLAVLCTPAL